MPYVPATCPNCGGDLRIDSAAEKGYCIHCGSMINFKEAVKNVSFKSPIELAGYESYPVLINLIEEDLKSGTNQTPEFKQRLIRALELNPDNQNLYSLVKSQIWNAQISEGTLVRYDGNSDMVFIPEGITAIGNMAFGRCHNLREITLPKSLKQIAAGAFIYESQLTINAYKGTFAAQYAVSSPATLNILDYTSEAEKYIDTIDNIFRELDTYKKSTIETIEKHLDKTYSINWILVFTILATLVVLFLIGMNGLRFSFSRAYLNIGTIIFLFLSVLASPILIIKTGYNEIRRKVAVKIQTALFLNKCNHILSPLGIVDFRYTRNIFDENYDDLESEVIKLQAARNKIISMNKSIFYKKPYIYYPLIEYLNGKRPPEYDK